MKYLQKGIWVLAALAGLTGLPSCSNESPWNGSDTEGGVKLSLSTNGKVLKGGTRADGDGTRADDSQCPIIPSADQFGVSLTSSDGTYHKTWPSLNAFNNETKFPIGDYELVASYGNIDQEGFELPYYEGKENIHISPNDLTEVSLTATLANAMVSVRYTEAFTQNFSAWSSALQTEGHDWVVLAQNETRPAFIDPTAGDRVKVSLTMTNMDGKKVTIEPTSFEAKARHHYIVTVNATGSVSNGTLALDVQFDDEVVNETVEVNLGDDLFSAPAPTVEAKGFEVDKTLELIQYDALSTSPEFNLFAFGGFQEVTLNIIGSGYTPSFGNEVQLVKAEPLVQSQLAKEGVKVSGLFKNLDKMAVINVKEFIEKLPSGEYTIQVQAKDVMTRLSDPCELKVKIDALDFTLTSPAESVDYGAEEVAVTLSSNAKGIKDIAKFRVPNANNQMVEATVKSVTQVSGPNAAKTRGELSYHYRYILGLDPVTHKTLDVEVNVRDIKETLKLNVTAPEYTVETDAFATQAAFKINCDSKDLANLIKNIKFYNGSSIISEGNLKRDASTGIIILAGLKASTTYTALKTQLGSFEKEIAAFTTESATDVPNGDFSQAGRNILIEADKFNDKIATGGEWKIALTKYWLRSGINRTEPQGWATLNDLTCWTGSSNKNTWYLVPSTYIVDGKTVIRTVGYSHNGETLPIGNLQGTNYYNPNAPENLNIAAGELFLGSYSFNGSESRADGISFASRPLSLSFDYKYTPITAGEQGEAVIKVLDASGTVLAQKSVALGSESTTSTKTVTLDSYPFGKKAAKLILGFRSVKSGMTPQIHKPTGSELKEDKPQWNTFTSTSGRTIPTNEYKAVATGSELVIDNVKLGYTGTSTISTQAPRRGHRK